MKSVTSVDIMDTQFVDVLRCKRFQSYHQSCHAMNSLLLSSAQAEGEAIQQESCGSEE